MRLTKKEKQRVRKAMQILKTLDTDEGFSATYDNHGQTVFSCLAIGSTGTYDGGDLRRKYCEFYGFTEHTSCWDKELPVWIPLCTKESQDLRMLLLEVFLQVG